MIEFVRGDLVRADAEALVNTVNCVGVMGRGIALQFRKAFPDNYREYRTTCQQQRLEPGMVLVHNLRRLANPRYVVNFPTKRHWRGKSRLEDVESGLAALTDEVRKLGIRSIAIPPLGCGLGGLRWADVRPLIESAFQGLPDVRVLLYEPRGAPSPDAMVAAARPPRLTVGRASLVALMSRYLAGVMDPFISLLEVHKLMYFMQEAGEPLRLRYQKAVYGPYADNLRHVLNTVEGHLITGYGDAEDRPDRHIGLTEGASDRAEAFLETHPETLARFDRVVDLIAGFESAFGMELLATVHWVAAHEGAKDAEDAAAKSHAWSERKRMFTADQIDTAWEVLQSKGSLSAGQAGSRVARA